MPSKHARVMSLHRSKGQIDSRARKAGLPHCVDNHGDPVSIFECRISGVHLPALGNRIEKVKLLNDVAVLPTDIVAVRPPGGHVGMAAFGDRDFPEA